MRTAILLVLVASALTASAADSQSEQPKRVEITGYDDHAMEPFISRDGRYLLFNNLNRPIGMDIHFAGRKDDFTWFYRGKVTGITPALTKGCPTVVCVRRSRSQVQRSVTDNLAEPGGSDSAKLLRCCARRSFSIWAQGRAGLPADSATGAAGRGDWGAVCSWLIETLDRAVTFLSVQESRAKHLNCLETQ
ncbi:MAG: hypothetical protein L0Z50_11480 [Verrucomicrobiales bacterium]|nr:hypothetical protein [Verrucomicrobiales bacterium]